MEELLHIFEYIYNIYNKIPTASEIIMFFFKIHNFNFRF